MNNILSLVHDLCLADVAFPKYLSSLLTVLSHLSRPSSPLASISVTPLNLDQHLADSSELLSAARQRFRACLLLQRQLWRFLQAPPLLLLAWYSVHRSCTRARKLSDRFRALSIARGIVGAIGPIQNFESMAEEAATLGQREEFAFAPSEALIERFTSALISLNCLLEMWRALNGVSAETKFDLQAVGQWRKRLATALIQERHRLIEASIERWTNRELLGTGLKDKVSG